MKHERETAVNGKYADGTTELQRANMRMIYEDPAAYREWRLKMGLAREDPRPVNPEMRARIGKLLREFANHLTAQPKPRDPWERPPARELTPEELAHRYVSDPVTLSEAARKLAGGANDGA